MYYVIDMQGFPGVSGSPVYDQDGNVIGIVLKGGKSVGTGLAYAELSAAITDLLGKNRSHPKTKNKTSHHRQCGNTF